MRLIFDYVGMVITALFMLLADIIIAAIVAALFGMVIGFAGALVSQGFALFLGILLFFVVPVVVALVLLSGLIKQGIFIPVTFQMLAILNIQLISAVFLLVAVKFAVEEFAGLTFVSTFIAWPLLFISLLLLYVYWFRYIYNAYLKKKDTIRMKPKNNKKRKSVK